MGLFKKKKQQYAAVNDVIRTRTIRIPLIDKRTGKIVLFKKTYEDWVFVKKYWEE